MSTLEEVMYEHAKSVRQLSEAVIELTRAVRELLAEVKERP